MRDILEKLSGTRPARWGIGTADAYLRQIGIDDADALKRASQTLCYCSADMCIEKRHQKELTPGSVMEFEAIVTTKCKDRDGDVLEPRGARVDPAAPLLWQHNHAEPVGKLLNVIQQSDKQVKARFAIVDSALGRDVAKLIEACCCRMRSAESKQRGPDRPQDVQSGPGEAGDPAAMLIQPHQEER